MIKPRCYECSLPRRGDVVPPKITTLAFLVNKIVKKLVGPIWRDPRRNSAYNRTANVQNSWMATRLVTKRYDFGSLGVPGPASTPLGALGPGGCRQAADFWRGLGGRSPPSQTSMFCLGSKGGTWTWFIPDFMIYAHFCVVFLCYSPIHLCERHTGCVAGLYICVRDTG